MKTLLKIKAKSVIDSLAGTLVEIEPWTLQEDWPM